MSDGQVMSKPARYRVNIKESAKGVCQVDCTAECEDADVVASAAVLLLQQTRNQLRAGGRPVTE
jgi:hypothetical protein